MPIAIVMLGLYVTACAGANHQKGLLRSPGAAGAEPIAPATASSGPGWGPGGSDFDGDGDNHTHDRLDADDQDIYDFGHAAGEPDVGAVAFLLASYYTAAAAHDGAAACPLLASSLARSLVENGVSSRRLTGARDKRCATALSKLFEHDWRRSSISLAGTMRVRLNGEEGLALVRLTDSEIREIRVERERGVWKVDALFDTVLP